MTVCYALILIFSATHTKNFQHAPHPQPTKTAMKPSHNLTLHNPSATKKSVKTKKQAVPQTENPITQKRHNHTKQNIAIHQ
jgi:hypothetical protein